MWSVEVDENRCIPADFVGTGKEPVRIVGSFGSFSPSFTTFGPRSEEEEAVAREEEEEGEAGKGDRPRPRCCSTACCSG
jgi:hypothetical protein